MKTENHFPTQLFVMSDSLKTLNWNQSKEPLVIPPRLKDVTHRYLRGWMKEDRSIQQMMFFTVKYSFHRSLLRVCQQGRIVSLRYMEFLSCLVSSVEPRWRFKRGTWCVYSMTTPHPTPRCLGWLALLTWLKQDGKTTEQMPCENLCGRMSGRCTCQRQHKHTGGPM